MIFVILRGFSELVFPTSVRTPREVSLRRYYVLRKDRDYPGSSQKRSGTNRGFGWVGNVAVIPGTAVRSGHSPVHNY
jgi:hypothetical protein